MQAGQPRNIELSHFFDQTGGKYTAYGHARPRHMDMQQPALNNYGLAVSSQPPNHHTDAT